MPCNQAEAVRLEIRGVVERVFENHKLQGGDKRVGFGVIVRPETHAHGLALSEEDPLVVSRHAFCEVLCGVNDGPEGAVYNQVENWRGVVGASVVVVGGADHVPGVAVDLHRVAVLAVGIVRERSDGGEDGDEDRGCQVPRGPNGDKAGVGEPFAAVDQGFDRRTAVY